MLFVVLCPEIPKAQPAVVLVLKRTAKVHLVICGNDKSCIYLKMMGLSLLR